jgi:hypothetical protein
MKFQANNFSKNSFNSKLCFLLDPAAGEPEKDLPTYLTYYYLKFSCLAS